MTKFFNKLKNPCFWPIFSPFPQFWGQTKFFLKDMALSRTTSYRLFLASCQNLEKTSDKISRKQALLYRTLLATAGGPKRQKDKSNSKAMTCFFQPNYQN